METTLILDDDLLMVARELTGLTDVSALVHEGLNALIVRESARHLSAPGSQPKLAPDRPRRLRGPR
jgi:Bacterial antitoxin of type II TA system, VapB